MTHAPTTPERMYSWDVFEPIIFRHPGITAGAFHDVGIHDLRGAAEYIHRLPYQRNARRDDPVAVLRERCGTCSTKHALMRRLAIEQDLNIALILGIYEMTGKNTPAIGAVLDKHHLRSLPEAHCFLRANGKSVDLTRLPAAINKAAIFDFLHEEEITPEQIREYKINLHKRFLANWMEDNPQLTGYGIESLWNIREECIAALSRM